MTIHIVPVDATHRAVWNALFQGYADFYGRPSDEAHKDRVWAWLMDPAHELEGFVAVADGVVVGLAHVRRMPSPARGTDIGFLDDLFVVPEARGRRVGEALLDFIAALAQERGWPLVRWMTADDNYAARTLYDRKAQKTSWNLYEMAPRA